MRLPGPKLEKQCPLQKKLVGVGRFAQPVQQTLGGIADKDKLELFLAITGTIQEPLADRSDDVDRPVFAHVSDSM